MPDSLRNGYFALALMGCVGLLAIFYISTTSSYSNGYLTADQEHQRYFANRAAAEDTYLRCLGAPTKDEALDCIKDGPLTSRETERAEEELNAQREMAQWDKNSFYGTGILGFATLILTAFGVWFVWKDLQEAKYANVILKKEQKPWLVLEIDHKGKVELTEDGFKENGEVIKEVWFVIKNAGKAAAIVDAIYRRWVICDGKKLPEPIPFGCNPPQGTMMTGKRKEGSIPIGGGGSSGPIKTTYSEQLKASDFCGIIKSRIYFYGYVEYHDLDGNKYMAGFCITFADGRFHAAWPYKNPELYHYHRSIGKNGQPIPEVFNSRASGE